MNDVITEKDYPIQGIWILESIVRRVVGLAILFSWVLLFRSRWELLRETFVDNGWAWVVYGLFTLLIVNEALQRVTFHYSVEDQFFTLRQGVLARQQSQIPYGGIQDIFVEQGLWDRIFGLATLTIEHTPYGTIDLPGLTKPHAEMLREIVLQKMKENPLENTQSGL